ncbi:MAG: single-stranded DNA-binding protein [Spirochaetaceae bacterium]|jgi:single-strand DNA-binding protein|nr:single-stranded DNA-binding protein [Spirochaetaceae bacterium]
MNHLNSILIEGRLVRDPLFRMTAKGIALCTFSIATERFYKQEGTMEKETSYFDVESWTKLAEKSRMCGHKGRGVRVVGRLRQDRWTNTEGKAKSHICIVAEHLEFRPEAKREGAGSAAAYDERVLTQVFADAPIPGF